MSATVCCQECGMVVPNSAPKRRNRLFEALCGSVQVLGREILRDGGDEYDIGALFSEIQTWGVSGLRKPLAEATGMKPGTILYRATHPRPAEAENQTVAGSFPMEHQWTPLKGVPCVYALHDAEGVIVYIGRTLSVRSRLKSHWTSDKRDAISTWSLTICKSEFDATDLEAVLIEQHRPTLNIRREKRPL